MGDQESREQEVQKEIVVDDSTVSVGNQYDVVPTNDGNHGDNKGNKAWMIASLVLAVLLVVVLIKPPFNSGAGSSDVVATVNGVDITKDKLYQDLVKASGSDALESIITNELIRQEVEKAKVTVTDEDINKEMAVYIEQFGSEEALDQALANYNMTREDLIKEMKLNLGLKKVLEPKATVTDDDVKKYFDEHKEEYNTPEQVQVSSILVGTQAEAEEVISQLNSGTDFAQLAKEKSLDTATKDKGGDLGYFGRGEQEEVVEEAAFKLEVDQISGALKTEEGYQVIKVTGHKEAAAATFEEKKEAIREGLLSEQLGGIYDTWLKEVKEKAVIKNTLTPETTEEQKTINQ